MLLHRTACATGLQASLVTSAGKCSYNWQVIIIVELQSSEVARLLAWWFSGASNKTQSDWPFHAPHVSMDSRQADMQTAPFYTFEGIM